MVIIMKKYVITIGRQFGCGAHEIATKLSEKLGVPVYDKEIIKRAAKDSGFDENIFSFYDEKPTNSFLYSVSLDGISAISSGDTTLENQVLKYQFDTIHKVADEGSCIIVGRCADYILRENENLLSVFLHADDDFRLERVVKIYGMDEKTAAKEIKSTDKKRARFYNFYSDNTWGEASAYDLTINVSRFGIDNTVDLISDYVTQKFA
ncbi:MAG: cytidylate kinase-like family protein [Clostridiales bacterium]|nr:cytidylate kinase-like family protein [Clostridiales bacterium]